jgi:parallel beta-helix repeat protein
MLLIPPIPSSLVYALRSIPVPARQLNATATVSRSRPLLRVMVLRACVVILAGLFSGLTVEMRAQTCGNGGACNPSSLNKTLYVDGVTYSLQSAIATANSLGNTTVIVPSSQTVSSGLTLTGKGVELTCQNNATLTAGNTGFWIITLSGVAQSVKNCGFSPGGYTGAQALLLYGAANPNIEGNTLSDFQAGNGSIYLVGASNAVLRNNRITAGTGGPDGIFGEKNTTDTTVEGNYVDESLGAPGAHAIGFHSTVNSQSVSGTKVVNNTILAGNNFCLEIGAFGGLTPSRVVVANNTCRLTENAGSGGYSLGVSGSSITGNSFDANGFTATIAGYEIVESSNTTVVGNSASIGQDWASVPVAAVTINRSNGISFTGNSINGWGGGNALAAAGYAVAVITGGVTNSLVSNNTISGNVLVFPKGLGSGGIFQQCQTSGSVCSNNSYSGNVLVGDGTANSLGFRLENDIGTMENAVISGNSIVGTNYGVYIWNPTVVGTHIDHNVFNTTSSDVIDNGTATTRVPISASAGRCANPPLLHGPLPHQFDTCSPAPELSSFNSVRCGFHNGRP